MSNTQIQNLGLYPVEELQVTVEMSAITSSGNQLLHITHFHIDQAGHTTPALNTLHPFLTHYHTDQAGHTTQPVLSHCKYKLYAVFWCVCVCVCVCMCVKERERGRVRV